jgi:CheY-like chemotaxis protein
LTVKRVLVVDDNDLNLKLMTYVLATEDCEVVTALDAKRARAALAASHFDLVLLDLQLPDMDGLSLTRLLREDPTTSQLVIVAVTAYAMKGDEERARAAGVNDYVTKPIAKDQLRKLVSRLLRPEQVAE